MIRLVSSPMSLWLFNALLTVATDTPQALEMSFIETMSLLLFARRLATPLLPVLRVAETIDRDSCYLGCLNDNLNPLNRIT